MSVKMITLDPKTMQVVKETVIHPENCPNIIFDPEHYKEDGSCYCFDKTHTIMKDWGYKFTNGEWQHDET